MEMGLAIDRGLYSDGDSCHNICAGGAARLRVEWKRWRRAS